MTTNHSAQLFPLSAAQRKVLTGRLNEKRVSQRSQSGRQLSYLEAWDVRAALIRVFGFAGWSAEVLDHDLVDVARDVPKFNKEGVKVGETKFQVTVWVKLQLTIHQTGATYTELAASTQGGAVFGDVLDFALKTAASDALKRGAMNLGTQFGLSLYDNGSLHDVVKVSFAPGQEWPIVEEPKESPQEGQAPATVTGKSMQELVAEKQIALAKERDDARVQNPDTGPEAPPEGSEEEGGDVDSAG